jgi:hypothetical protein
MTTRPEAPKHYRVAKRGKKQFLLDSGAQKQNREFLKNSECRQGRFSKLDSKSRANK